ncbi:hypothetical protein BASA81_011312 [Batrachochytrium salamandrivorans]|nr:hypothetical protein BASA81_011312 [Batrachochytrium salamandrivorans]
MNPSSSSVPLTLAELEQQMFLRHQQDQQKRNQPSAPAISSRFEQSFRPSTASSSSSSQPSQPLSGFALPPPAQSPTAFASQTSPPASPSLKSSKAASTEEVVLVGTIEVRPTVTGPDEFIEVSWSIPKSSGNNPADWIGLFRARQKLNDNANFILNRDTAQRTQFDLKSHLFRGKVRLRTPKGVGQYDFRFFSGHATVPIARSNLVTVEVQGTALLEALEFINKNAKDKKRLAAAAAQLASLIKQIRTLRGGKPVASNTNTRQQGGVVLVERPEQQELRVMEELWKAILHMVSQGVDLCLSLMDQCDEWQRKCSEAKLELSEQDLVEDLDQHELATTTATATDEVVPPSPSIKPVQDAKKQAWIQLMANLSHAQRERSSVASSVYQVLEEVMLNQHVVLARERYQMLQAYLNCYCPVEEHFYANVESLQVHMLCEYGLLNFVSATRMLRVPAVDEWNYYLTHLVKRELAVGPLFFDQRKQIIFRLQQLISETFARARLVPFGSSANSFGGPNSDLDLCLVFEHPLQQDGAVQVVELIATALSRFPDEFSQIDDSRKTARIPIVKFVSVVGGIECDICVNNPLAIRNTLLLRTYASIDPRVGALVSLVKHWSKRRNINDPASHTLSSYGWILLTLNFLQRIDLLPVLQDMPVNNHNLQPYFPQVLTLGTDGKHQFETYFFGDPESAHFRTQEAKEHAALEARRLSTQCQQTVPELLAAFWWDLAMGAWRRNVVSVRQGEFVQKSVKAAEDAWRLHGRVSIEDPFEVSYDVGHVLRDGPFKRMRKEALRGYGLLTGSLDGLENASVPQRMEEIFRSAQVPKTEEHEGEQ